MVHKALLDGGTSFLDSASTFMAIQDCESWEDVAIESARELFIPTGFGVVLSAGKMIHDWIDVPPPDVRDDPNVKADEEDDSSWTVLARPS